MDLKQNIRKLTLIKINMKFHGSTAQWRVIHRRMLGMAKMPIDATHHTELFSMICSLFAKTNLSIPSIQVAPSKLVDAEISFFLNPFTGRATPENLYITQGAINNYNSNQMKGMIAHEIGHLLQNRNLSPQEAEYDADKRSAELTSPHDIISALSYFQKNNPQEEIGYSQKQNMKNYFSSQNNSFLAGLMDSLPATNNSDSQMPSTNVNNVHPGDKKRIARLVSLEKSM